MSEESGSSNNLSLQGPDLSSALAVLANQQAQLLGMLGEVVTAINEQAAAITALVASNDELLQMIVDDMPDDQVGGVLD